MDVLTMLDTLAEYQAQRDVMELEAQSLKDTILTPEIKAQLAAIDAEFADKSAAVDANIAALTEQIKAAVVAGGATVKGAHLQAVYTKGRVSWDSEILDGLAMVIAKARKVGDPSVSIRKVG